VSEQFLNGTSAQYRLYSANRKCFLVNVQLITTHTGYVMDVVERWPGSVYDSTIFDNSQVRETLLTSSSGWLRLL